MHDLVIRNGTVVDGSGSKRYTGDVAIEDDRIVEVGSISGRGKREIDADGLLVTPGWVDIHTHYDGQALWDPYLTPSSWHGCTTVVMGNCGVGFAPVAMGREDWLIELMESVEDIPGAALSEGIDWGWESFGGYLNALDRLQRAIDIGTQVPHCAVRAYVMGDRCLSETTAAPEDIEAMTRASTGWDAYIQRIIEERRKTRLLVEELGARRDPGRGGMRDAGGESLGGVAADGWRRGLDV